MSKAQFRALCMLFTCGLAAFITSSLMSFYEDQEPDDAEYGSQPIQKAKVTYRKELREFWIEKIMDRPRIFILHNLLSKEECENMKDLGIARGMKRNALSPVLGDDPRKHEVATLDFNENDFVRRLEDKLANLTRTSASHGEAFQIIRYSQNDFYPEHVDYISPSQNDALGKGGNRIATVIIYLKSAGSGGETFFNSVNTKINVASGDAILLWNMNKDMTPDTSSKHSGLPPLSGEKWVAVKWIREHPFQQVEANVHTRPRIIGKRVESAVD